MRRAVCRYRHVARRIVSGRAHESRARSGSGASRPSAEASATTPANHPPVAYDLAVSTGQDKAVQFALPTPFDAEASAEEGEELLELLVTMVVTEVTEALARGATTFRRGGSG